MRNKVSNIVIGAIFILIGFAFIANLSGLWAFDIFFDGWWTVFIILPCIFSMIRHGINVGNIIGTGIGVMLLLAEQDFLSYRNFWKYLIPLVLIAIGLGIIFGGHFKKKYNDAKPFPVKDGKVPDYFALFGGNSPNYDGSEFDGADISGIFGGVELNLKNAIINNDCVITATCVFGGADIHLPSNVKCQLATTPIFGGADNKFVSSSVPDAPTVFINATCIFGGLDVD